MMVYRLRTLIVALQLTLVGLVIRDARALAAQDPLATEHRLTAMESDMRNINERLARIETLGYGVVGASMLQLFDLFVTRRKKGVPS